MTDRDRLLIEVRHERDRVVLCLCGELDLLCAPLLELEIENLQIAQGSVVVLDLQEIQFIDSTGLRAILSAHERLRSFGGKLAVTRGSQQVQRLLSLTRLGDHLQVISSPEEMLV